MSSNITLSAGVRQNLLALQNTADLLSITQNRLATGKKVNSALDNPFSFFTSQSLNNRAGDLNALLDSIGQGQQTLKAADTGITALTKLVESAKSIAKQAQQSSEPETTTNAAVLTGTVGSLTGGTTLDTLGLATGETISVSDGTNTETFTVGADPSTEDIDDVIAVLNGGSATWTVALNGGFLEVTSDNTDDTLTVSGTGSAAVFGTTTTASPTTSVVTPDTTRADLEDQYNALLAQIDQQAGDASYNGINLLSGDDLKIVFNEDGSSSLTITGVTFTSNGLGLSALSGEFQINTDIDTVVGALDAALSTLRTQATTFGSNLGTVQTRQEFTKGLINTLQVGADNLVLADVNEESANMLALQTRQQLSTTALSLAAQADQAVLRLF